MAYGLIPVLISVAVVVAFVAVADASIVSKIVLVILLAFSLWCTFQRPEWGLLGMFIQVAIGIFVLAYIRLQSRSNR